MAEPIYIRSYSDGSRPDATATPGVRRPRAEEIEETIGVVDEELFPLLHTLQGPPVSNAPRQSGVPKNESIKGYTQINNWYPRYLEYDELNWTSDTPDEVIEKVDRMPRSAGFKDYPERTYFHESFHKLQDLFDPPEMQSLLDTAYMERQLAQAMLSRRFADDENLEGRKFERYANEPPELLNPFPPHGLAQGTYRPIRDLEMGLLMNQETRDSLANLSIPQSLLSDPKIQKAYEEDAKPWGPSGFITYSKEMEDVARQRLEKYYANLLNYADYLNENMSEKEANDMYYGAEPKELREEYYQDMGWSQPPILEDDWLNQYIRNTPDDFAKSIFDGIKARRQSGEITKHAGKSPREGQLVYPYDPPWKWKKVMMDRIGTWDNFSDRVDPATSEATQEELLKQQMHDLRYYLDRQLAQESWLANYIEGRKAEEAAKYGINKWIESLKRSDK